MKIFKITLFIILFAFLLPSAANALTAKATWGYNATSTTDLAGFNFYREGTKIGEIKDPSAREYGGLEITDTGKFCYTMTAVDAAGQESPHSPCYYFDPPPESPTDLKFTVIVNVTVVQP